MGKLFLATASVFLALHFSAAQKGNPQLPCTHPLRIAWPQFFTHCESICRYTTWSSWRKVPNSIVSVPPGKCPSGEAYSEERRRISTGKGCTEALREMQLICLPTQEERLILGLGLGGSGNNFEPFEKKDFNSTMFPPEYLDQEGLSSMCASDDRICQSLPSTRKSFSSNQDKESSLPTQGIIKNDIDPLPFDWLEHSPRLFGQRCGEQSTQHVLFVLDASRSNDPFQFQRIQDTVALLPSLFCKQVKFAVVTFSSYINLEFCFNCFNNTLDGRAEVADAIKNVKHHDNGRVNSETANTARCVCEEILQPACGIDVYPDCLDVVFITDGKNKDSSLAICQEISCLHYRLGVDTYAVSINHKSESSHRTGLNCITSYGGLANAFEFESVDEFEQAIQNILQRLSNAQPDGQESCTRLDASYGLRW